MNSVLITGVGGFLGALVAKRFRESGWRVHGFGRRIPEFGERADFTVSELPSRVVEDAIRQVKPDVCIHCAGNANPRLSMSDPILDFESGPQLTSWLLDTFRRHSSNTRFVFLSSAAVYGNPLRLPITEQDSAAPISPYGFSKLQCESLLSCYRQVFGLSTTSLRIFSAYGPKLRRQVIWDLLTKIDGRDVIKVAGTGNESRDFVFGADVADAAYRVSILPTEPEPIYNVASGQETSIASLIELICESAGRHPAIQFDGRQQGGMPLNWRADIARLRAVGWEPSTSLSVGIDKIVEWIRENKE